mmetsp:Transcript_36957/g.66479  ORF Transcript_36957/g.66479 Transcript_36957/m.66479 type:complete len:357 (-) Transcript_36957:57-1127(-)
MKFINEDNTDPEYHPISLAEDQDGVAHSAPPVSRSDGSKSAMLRNIRRGIFLALGVCALYLVGTILGGMLAGPLFGNIRSSSQEDDDSDQLMRAPELSRIQTDNEHHHMRAPELSRIQNGDSTFDKQLDIPAINIESNKDLSDIDQTLLKFLSGSSYARAIVVDLMVKEYVNQEAPDIELSDRLEDAVEAMEISEKDGEPVQVKDHPFLFVGSVGASMNLEALQRNNITHVINWSSTARCNIFSEINYLCIPNISGYKAMNKNLDKLDMAVEFIESARKVGGRAMSHCWFGRNRSVTLLVAYLMKYEGMDSEDALHLVQKTRPIADSYRDSLQYYYQEYVRPLKKKEAKAKKHDDP